MKAPRSSAPFAGLIDWPAVERLVLRGRTVRTRDMYRESGSPPKGRRLAPRKRRYPIAACLSAIKSSASFSASP